MPMVFAFRIADCFFCMGPKSKAVLKINGEKLLQIQDDGGFLKWFDYFASLGDSAHPEFADPRTRAITCFQELLLISFREFAVISDETILSERRKYRNEIVNSIESFSKRSAVRNLKTLGKFTKEQVGFVYDALYKAMCEVPPPSTVGSPPSLLATNDGNQERAETRIGIPKYLPSFP
ncbi:hypothetical protein BDR04DRAFT_1158700 [Suillus decipiens]|nr:hypothetical protein BDR04DRAFT_1158700 [Suillus decipiens]